MPFLRGIGFAGPQIEFARDRARLRVDDRDRVVVAVGDDDFSAVGGDGETRGTRLDLDAQPCFVPERDRRAVFRPAVWSAGIDMQRIVDAAGDIEMLIVRRKRDADVGVRDLDDLRLLRLVPGDVEDEDVFVGRGHIDFAGGPAQAVEAARENEKRLAVMAGCGRHRHAGAMIGIAGEPRIEILELRARCRFGRDPLPGRQHFARARIVGVRMRGRDGENGQNSEGKALRFHLIPLEASQHCRAELRQRFQTRPNRRYSYAPSMKAQRRLDGQAKCCRMSAFSRFSRLSGCRAPRLGLHL